MFNVGYMDRLPSVVKKVSSIEEGKTMLKSEYPNCRFGIRNVYGARCLVALLPKGEKNRFGSNYLACIVIRAAS